MAKKMKSADGRTFGLLAIGLLVFSLVLMGCSDEATGPTEITGTVATDNPNVSAPSVTAEKTNDGKYLILSWNAVENAGGYTVYQNQRDKRTITSLSGSISPMNGITYKKDGTTAANSDPDKWNVRVALTAPLGAASAEYRFGVRTSASSYDGVSRDSSVIAWSGYEATTVHPYTALLGTWIKDGSTTGPKFVIDTYSSGSMEYITWELYSASGSYLSESTIYSISGTTVSFSGQDDSYNSFTARLTGGELVVSGYTGSRGLAGNYIKQ